MGGPKDLKSGLVVLPLVSIFFKVVLTIPRRCQIIKKEFPNLSQSLSTDKNGCQGIWKFSVKCMGGPKDLKSGHVVPPLASIFFKVVLTIPRRFQIIKKEFPNLSESLSTDKNGCQGIWKFSVKCMGGPKDLKSGPVVPPLVSIFFKSGSNYP